ncbi:hypothetical protein EJ05DRAFT_478932 [Pseudovirgaria hyperparasitica]|uniref:Uncharacterized protein n=1 Tax=Pseudovirgaria hyperparasitica TaxID=470096 RepID=A0A6A6VY54_9PEZI|nr:uncharacterized protein EJ05DRAFT_478932 [Pseudovirgaria hyperparasitica]KAF2755125.1 hypothetical protein EJ05DRAFT_478932 [Pseudovirgaria hyperparasitica]
MENWSAWSAPLQEISSEKIAVTGSAPPPPPPQSQAQPQTGGGVQSSQDYKRPTSNGTSPVPVVNEPKQQSSDQKHWSQWSQQPAVAIQPNQPEKEFVAQPQPQSQHHRASIQSANSGHSSLYTPPLAPHGHRPPSVHSILAQAPSHGGYTPHIPASVAQPVGTSPTALLPNQSQLATNLRLGHTFGALKSEIYFRSGIFDINDSWLPASGPLFTEDVHKATNRIREKRWAIFVCRAVDRFTAWWEAMKQSIYDQPVTCGDLNTKDINLLQRGLSRTTILTKERLPPLDVLMVWHTFMLSPQRYLEDCLLQGMMGLWHGGFPWMAIDQAIDTRTGIYDPGPTAAASFLSMTGRAWVNTHETGIKPLGCPSCAYNGWPPNYHVRQIHASNFGSLLATEQQQLQMKVNYRHPIITDIDAICWKAAGWADAGYLVICSNCKNHNTQDTLRAQKLVYDIVQFHRPNNMTDKFMVGNVHHLRPPPGVLFGKQGTPRTAGMINGIADGEGFFPIRLMDAIANIDGSGARRTGKPNFRFTMEALLQDVQTSLSKSPKHLNYAQMGGHNISVNYKGGQWNSGMDEKEGLAVRKTLRYYLDNSSPFTLDLVTATIRNGVFSQKMENLGWWRSTQLPLFAPRLIEKYRRFFTLHSKASLLSSSSLLAVPTTDVDLAWHTHLLSPAQYYNFSLQTVGRLIDHCDKIPEAYLSQAFAQTCKKYEAAFAEPYSECICWYCEAIRTANNAGGFVGNLFKSSSKDKKPIWAHPLLANATSDPGVSTHISSHNAVRVEKPDLRYAELHAEHQKWLEDGWRKAVERAGKEGRSRPVAAKTNWAPYVVNADLQGPVTAASTATVNSWVEGVLRDMYGWT